MTHANHVYIINSQKKTSHVFSNMKMTQLQQILVIPQWTPTFHSRISAFPGCHSCRGLATGRYPGCLGGSCWIAKFPNTFYKFGPRADRYNMGIYKPKKMAENKRDIWGDFTLLIGVLTPFTSGWGPPTVRIRPKTKYCVTITLPESNSKSPSKLFAIPAPGNLRKSNISQPLINNMGELLVWGRVVFLRC